MASQLRIRLFGSPRVTEGQRQLVELLARTGQRTAALAQYETCRLALAEELGAVRNG